MPYRILILGAGISGLSLAYRLQQSLPSADITILEKANRPGGTVWTLREEGFQVEIGPNGFLDNKPTTLNLCRDLGLERSLQAGSESAHKNRYLFLGDKLQALPGGLAAFLKSPLLSWRGKLAFITERFRSAKRSGEDETIDAFATRRAGREAARLFADALVTGIYAGDPKLLSLAACFPRLAEFEKQHGSVLKGFAVNARQRRLDAKRRGEPKPPPSRMWSLGKGLRELIETLTEKLVKPPLLGVAAKRIEHVRDDGWRVFGEGTDSWQADAVILACPAHEQADLLADVDRSLTEEVSGIAYNRVVVVALGYRQADVPHDLDGFGYIAPQNLKRDLLGVQWCSSIYPNRAPAGMVLLRAMCGGWQRPEIVDWDDNSLLTALRAELKLALGIEAEASFVRVIRWPKAIPQYHVGHLQRLRRIEDLLARHAGLFLAGNAYRGVALNDCTEQGELLARRVAGYLGSR